jgi:hypothetical protein
MTKPDKHKSFDEIMCLWMKCGAVDYKICDKNFECETCDFDKHVLNDVKMKENLQEKIENMFDLGQRSVSFTHPYYHFSNGMTARNFLTDSYYIGLEPFIVKFLEKNIVLKYSNLDISVNKGEPILNISGDWGDVDLLSPLDFCYLERFDTDNIVSKDIRWFAVVEVERHGILSSSISKKSYFDKLFETKLNLVNLLRTYEHAGFTMYDGGAVLESWSDILGKSTYRNLLMKLFS